MSLRQIAAEAQCGLRTVARWMAIHAIPTRDVGAARSAVDRSGASNPNWRGGTRKTCMGCGADLGYQRRRRCRACHAAYAQGENNPNWRGIADVTSLVRQWCYDHWRPLIFERDGYACQECGDARGGNLQAHHVMPLATLIADRKAYWEPDIDSETGRLAFAKRLLADTAITTLDNGVTLCESCHQRRHSE